MRCVIYRNVFLYGNVTQVISDDNQFESTVFGLILLIYHIVYTNQFQDDALFINIVNTCCFKQKTDHAFFPFGGEEMEEYIYIGGGVLRLYLVSSWILFY